MIHSLTGTRYGRGAVIIREGAIKPRTCVGMENQRQRQLNPGLDPQGAEEAEEVLTFDLMYVYKVNSPVH